MAASNDMGSTNFSKDDMFMILEAYGNIVTLNTTLVEQGNRILDRQNDLLKNQEELVKHISKLLESQRKIIDDFTKFAASAEVKHGSTTNKINVAYATSFIIIIQLIAILAKVY